MTIAGASFDTIIVNAPVGTACQTQVECGDPAVMVCDPKDATCQKATCPATACPTGQTCIGEADSADVGVCFSNCTPFATTTPCATGFSCLPNALDGSDGLCYRTGTGTEGAACAPSSSDVSSRCAAGLTCVTEGTAEVCRAICNYWSATPGCATGNCDLAAGESCSSTGETAAIGAACSKSAEDGVGCAPANGKYTGACFSGKCEQFCVVAKTGECPTDTTCTAVFGADEPVGLCRVPPPAAWKCDATYYNDGSVCDCDCGAWDPDCDNSSNEIDGCDDNQTCEKPNGTCK